MDFMLDLNIKKIPDPIRYTDKIMLTGSCFTEHIGSALERLKFKIFQNPNGILFGPDAVCKSLLSYIDNKQYTPDDLFYLNEIWNSWDHHSRFSHIDKEECLKGINESQNKAHHFLKDADWLIITLGSSYSYLLGKETSPSVPFGNKGVANCHRAPADWFTKIMLETGEISSLLTETILRLLEFNPKLRLIFTISPVRHIRDGVVENNRSKARLLEAVHKVVDKFATTFYFPAYELVIDVLRDYRYYDIDLVHPNYAATEFVMKKFSDSCIDESARPIMDEVQKIVTARRHRAFQPETKMHKQFLENHFNKARSLQERYPFLDLKEEIIYFSRT